MLLVTEFSIFGQSKKRPLFPLSLGKQRALSAVYYFVLTTTFTDEQSNPNGANMRFTSMYIRV